MPFQAVLAAALLAASQVVWSSRALAADPRIEAAQALFDEAKAMAREGKWHDACAKFEESQKLDPSGGTLLHLGICHDRIGLTGSAWAELNEALSMARRDGRPDREAAALAQLEALRPRLSTLRVVLSAEARRTPGLIVERDGVPFSTGQVELAVPVDPGPHNVRATAPGYKPWATTVDVVGSGMEVTVPVLERETPRPAGSYQAPQTATATHAIAVRSEGQSRADEARSEDNVALRVLGYALGGVGLVALGTSGVFAFETQSLVDQRDEAAARGDAAATRDYHERALGKQTLAIIVGAAGAASLGAGIGLILVARPSAAGDRAPSASNAASWTVGLGGRW